jgi:hypothetical protein
VATTQDNIQLAMEESPRYEGAATTTPYRVSTTVAYLPVQTARIVPGPTHVDRGDEVRGIEGQYPSLIETYEPAGTIGMRAYANPLTWMFQVAGWTGAYTLGNGVITDPDAATIPAGANRWVFTKRGGITAKTLQALISYVDEGVFLRGQGFGISGWTLNADGAFTADLMGLVFGRIADPNVSPTYDVQTIPHFRRGDLNLTWLTGSGVTEDFTIAETDPLVRRRTLGLATPSYFPDKLEHGDDRVGITGTIPKTIFDPDDLDALMTAATFAAKARWKSPTNIGATSYKYSMWLEMPACQYIGGTMDELANRRRFGASFDWAARWDDTAGYDAKITIVNGVTAAALETLV